jgi:hypothetical protein
MTKTGLQIALAEATQTDKKTAGTFLDALAAIAYKASKRRASSSCRVLASWSNRNAPPAWGSTPKRARK